MMGVPIHRILVLPALVSIWLLAQTGPACAGLTLQDAWIAETPPGATTAAGYLVFSNDGDDATAVVGALSPACERIEFHTTDTTDGIARMRRQAALEVPAGGSLALEPAGTHLMLIRPRPLAAGDRVLIRFALEGGEELAVEAEVRAPGHDAHQHHAH